MDVCFQVGNVLVVPLVVLRFTSQSNVGVHKLIPLQMKLTRIYASVSGERLVPRPN